MEDKQHYWRLGLFVIVTVAALFTVLFILGGRSLFQPSFTVETYFDEPVSGLEVGAPVKFRGVPVGQVSPIETAAPLYQENVPFLERKPYVVVRAKITGPRAERWKKDLAQLVKRGLRVQTQMAGITGQQYLELDFLDADKHPPLAFDWTPAVPYVPSAPSLTDQIIANVQNFLASLDKADVEQLGQNLNALVVSLNEKVDKTPIDELVREATGVLKNANAAINRLDRVIAASPIDQTVRNLESASGRLDKLLATPGFQQTADDAAVFAGRLRKIAESGELERMVKSLDQTVRRADAMLGNNQYDVRATIQDLRATAANLRTLSEIAKNYPAGVLIGGPPKKVTLQKESK